MIISVAIVYAAITCIVYALQRTLVFRAASERVLPDPTVNHNVEEITLKTKTGERLFSWYGPAPVNRPTVLYLQETGLLEAAEIANRHLTEAGLAASEIILFGESLGSSEATQLAEKVSASALVLAAPMHSIREIAKAQYPFLPIGLLLKDPFLSFQHIGNVDEAVLVFHGSNDQAIPIESGKRLFALANEPKIFHTIDGAGHNNLFDFEIIDRLDQSLKEDHFENHQ